MASVSKASPSTRSGRFRWRPPIWPRVPEESGGARDCMICELLNKRGSALFCRESTACQKCGSGLASKMASTSIETGPNGVLWDDRQLDKFTTASSTAAEAERLVLSTLAVQTH